MTFILIRVLVHISKILTVSLTQKRVFRTKHVYALSPSFVCELLYDPALLFIRFAFYLFFLGEEVQFTDWGSGEPNTADQFWGLLLAIEF